MCQEATANKKRTTNFVPGHIMKTTFIDEQYTRAKTYFTKVNIGTS